VDVAPPAAAHALIREYLDLCALHPPPLADVQQHVGYMLGKTGRGAGVRYRYSGSHTGPQLRAALSASPGAVADAAALAHLRALVDGIMADPYAWYRARSDGLAAAAPGVAALDRGAEGACGTVKGATSGSSATIGKLAAAGAVAGGAHGSSGATADTNSRRDPPTGLMTLSLCWRMLAQPAEHEKANDCCDPAAAAAAGGPRKWPPTVVAVAATVVGGTCAALLLLEAARSFAGGWRRLSPPGG
jgi:hypothetical protein